MSDKKRGTFVSGLIILLPTLITLFLLLIAFRFINNNIAQPLGALIISIIKLIPLQISEKPVWASVIGFPVTIIIVYLVGYFTASFLGKRLFKGIEIWIMTRFPIIRDVYPYARQFIDTFISAEKKTKFKSVVAVEFPHAGIYATGFITADGLKDLREKTGQKIITVFVPTSPAPFTGFTLFVPEDKVIHLNMTIDEAIRTIMSGGVLTPPHQQPDKEKKEE
ncbi:MAG TPA: DUF502 domain-containing protein [Planctomycetota bacterium]|nr:DUF502 domain-containing protein [Planctomycetota bacterium]